MGAGAEPDFLLDSTSRVDMIDARICLAFQSAVAVAALLTVSACAEGGTEEGRAPSYQEASSEHADGTGRYYMGREIARVTGVDRQEWLDRPQRETEELPNRVVRALELRSTDVVADIGAGTGYFTFRIG
ncbi:MAG: hypothetical protein WD205_03315, partial [Rhodothermales bacterium]